MKSTRRSFLPAAASALIVPLLSPRPAVSRPQGDCPPETRAKLRKAAAELEAALDELDELLPLATRSYRGGAEPSHETLKRVWYPCLKRHHLAEDRLRELMAGCGVGALIAGGELYFDSGQDDTPDIGDNQVFCLDASLILNLDATE